MKFTDKFLTVICFLDRGAGRTTGGDGGCVAGVWSSTWGQSNLGSAAQSKSSARPSAIEWSSKPSTRLRYALRSTAFTRTWAASGGLRAARPWTSARALPFPLRSLGYFGALWLRFASHVILNIRSTIRLMLCWIQDFERIDISLFQRLFCCIYFSF